MSDEEEILRLSELQVTEEDRQASSTHPPRHGPSAVDQEVRDEALRVELAGVRQLNKVVEGVVASLKKSKENMEAVSTTVDNANKLLDHWIRILSQTEHTQRLIFNGRWEGGTQDLAAIEAEALAKAQAAERRKEQERARRAALERQAAEDEARRASGTKPTRGRGRGSAGSSSTRGGASGSKIGIGSSGGIPRGRSSGSGSGRGTGGTRGRGRGVK
ncbi:hypothetical protein RUND412_010396 [Rhizina undulata]